MMQTTPTVYQKTQRIIQKPICIRNQSGSYLEKYPSEKNIHGSEYFTSFNNNIPSLSLDRKNDGFRQSNTISNYGTINKSYEAIPSENRLSQLERDREYLILKNIELEKEINRLDKMFTKIFQSNNNLHQNSSQPSIQTQKRISLLPKNESSLTLSEKNTKLRRKIREMENTINTIKANNNFNSKSTIRKEIKLWKERANELCDNFVQTLNDLKCELKKDKIAFKVAIRKIQNKFDRDVNDVMNSYQMVIQKNEKRIQLLMKENSELRKKEEKVKEVFLYNFQ